MRHDSQHPGIADQWALCLPAGSAQLPCQSLAGGCLAAQRLQSAAPVGYRGDTAGTHLQSMWAEALFTTIGKHGRDSTSSRSHARPRPSFSIAQMDPTATPPVLQEVGDEQHLLSVEVAALAALACKLHGVGGSRPCNQPSRSPQAPASPGLSISSIMLPASCGCTNMREEEPAGQLQPGGAGLDSANGSRRELGSRREQRKAAAGSF